MIRLIASDLDGTLLNSQRQLPKDFFSVIDRLNQLGVLFIAASGRSYPTLRRDFAPHSDELCFISDNGARIAEHGKFCRKILFLPRWSPRCWRPAPPCRK